MTERGIDHKMSTCMASGGIQFGTKVHHEFRTEIERATGVRFSKGQICAVDDAPSSFNRPSKKTKQSGFVRGIFRHLQTHGITPRYSEIKVALDDIQLVTHLDAIGMRMSSGTMVFYVIEIKTAQYLMEDYKKELHVACLNKPQLENGMPNTISNHHVLQTSFGMHALKRSYDLPENSIVCGIIIYVCIDNIFSHHLNPGDAVPLSRFPRCSHYANKIQSVHRSRRKEIAIRTKTASMYKYEVAWPERIVEYGLKQRGDVLWTHDKVLKGSRIRVMIVGDDLRIEIIGYIKALWDKIPARRRVVLENQMFQCRDAWRAYSNTKALISCVVVCEGTLSRVIVPVGVTA